jgi:CRISPR/Cas system-associated exonuclease Cas4 (RecB family)
MYEECPAKFAYKNLDKLPDPGGAAMQRGTDIHKLAEDYLTGKLKALPKELALFKEEFKALKSEKIKSIEDNWVWTKDWKAETVGNDWNNAWVRIKIDAAYINTEHMALVPIDFKTGKYSTYKLDAYLDQLELYALAGLKRHPEVQIVSPRLWYLDVGVIHPDPEKSELEYTRKDEAKLEKKFAKRIIPLFNDKTYKPKPSDAACRFCPYSKAKMVNGEPGPCPY